MAQSKHLTNVTKKKKITPLFTSHLSYAFLRSSNLQQPLSQSLILQIRMNLSLSGKKFKGLNEVLYTWTRSNGHVSVNTSVIKTQGLINIFNITPGLMLYKEFSTIMMKILIFFFFLLSYRYIYTSLTLLYSNWLFILLVSSDLEVHRGKVYTLYILCSQYLAQILSCIVII